ncbi:hypothetical protein O181_117586 [Austropuccinia psidii MF-1]|uniref:CCHC-type domain-containing protein n=1 Tax=Austropuccinia psidii MF-1 TaxID=1389203 RepID=A0A9Q3KCY7_9BASI|nr:hypothetical protein [Austropuccinia psidii MF-1]
MEDARASTSSQRLASTFEPLIESPKADITAIAVVRPESLSTGNNRDIPVSVQELVYGSKTVSVRTSPKSLDRHHELISSSEEVHGARKDRGTPEGLDTHVLQRTNPTDKILVEKPKHVIRGPEEEVDPRQGKRPSGSSPKPPQAKLCLNKCQTSSRKPQRPARRARKRGESHGQCVQYGKNSDGVQKQGRGKIEPIFSKEVNLIKLLKELIIQVKNLENSTGHNAALFKEQLEKSEKARLELKEDIQSSINNISLTNDLPRQSEPILDINVLNLNNDLHHTISSNAEKDRLTALHPDMSETIVHKRILKKCGGDLEHAIKIRCIEPCSTEDSINSMEDITTRKRIGRNWYKHPTDNKTSGKPIPKPNKPHEKAPLECHKCGSTSHLANTCPKKTRINEI